MPQENFIQMPAMQVQPRPGFNQQQNPNAKLKKIAMMRQFLDNRPELQNDPDFIKKLLAGTGM